MESSAQSSLASALAVRLRESRAEVTGRWLERIAARVSVDPNRIFPSDELLDHMPLLVLGIAEYVAREDEALAAQASVLDRARELGALRHAQGFDEYEILKEYELLGGVLHSYLSRAAEECGRPCRAEEILGCAHRLFQAIALIQQATLTHYLQLMRGRVREREDRLRAFNRALTHELRNRIGAVYGAAHLLDMPELGASDRAPLVGVIVRNVDSMRIALDNLLELTRIGTDGRQQKHVRLPEVVAEAARQVRDMARASGVVIRLPEEMPDVEVNAAAVELCLVNLLSNAVKYADVSAPERMVAVTGCLILDANEQPLEVAVEVRDNGIGVPASQREMLFERFFRADNALRSSAGGTGLGLSIVREVMESVGGRVWAEFPGKGSVFSFAMPCRRAQDAPVLPKPFDSVLCRDS